MTARRHVRHQTAALRHFSYGGPALVAARAARSILISYSTWLWQHVPCAALGTLDSAVPGVASQPVTQRLCPRVGEPLRQARKRIYAQGARAWKRRTSRHKRHRARNARLRTKHAARFMRDARNPSGNRRGRHRSAHISRKKDAWHLIHHLLPYRTE